MWGRWGFGGMGVSVGLRQERGGSVGVEGTVGGTEGHEAGDRDASIHGVSGMDRRREGRGWVGRGGRGVAIK